MVGKVRRRRRSKACRCVGSNDKETGQAATKAELEAELKALKQDLTAARAKAEDNADDAAPGPATGLDETGASGEAPGTEKDGPLDWAMSQLEGSEIDTLFK